MDRRLVVIKQGHVGQEGKKLIESLSRIHGWQIETIELSKDEPLPKSLDDIKGLIILGGPINVYEQYTNPYMKIYFNP